jgi:hypothetical protein
MNFQTSALILTWVALLLLALVVSGLVRQLHQLTSGALRAPGLVGLAPGAAAPDLDRVLAGHTGPALLLFLSVDCRTCAAILADLPAYLHRLATAGVGIRALYAGPAPAAVPVEVLADAAGLFDRYDAVATPFAVLVDATGRVERSQPLGSTSALAALVDQVAGPTAVRLTTAAAGGAPGQAEPAAAVSAGQPAAVSAGQPAAVSAGQPAAVSAGQPAGGAALAAGGAPGQPEPAATEPAATEPAATVPAGVRQVAGAAAVRPTGEAATAAGGAPGRAEPAAAVSAGVER